MAAPDGPAVARRAGHAAERVGESARDREDQNHLEEIREWSGIFERMRAVGVEKSAAVGAEHFDGFLRRDRADGDGLLRDCLRRGFAVGALRLDAFAVRRVERSCRV